MARNLIENVKSSDVFNLIPLNLTIFAASKGANSIHCHPERSEGTHSDKGWHSGCEILRRLRMTFDSNNKYY